MTRTTNENAETITEGATTRATIAGHLAVALTRSIAWAVSRFRPLQVHHLGEDECEARGLPYGASAPHVYCWPVRNAARWRMDLWNDGDGCISVNILGWHGEVHYETKQPAETGTTA